MSLDFEKVTYVDGETVIGADNLNDIQDALLYLIQQIPSASYSGSPVTINSDAVPVIDEAILTCYPLQAEGVPTPNNPIPVYDYENIVLTQLHNGEIKQYIFQILDGEGNPASAALLNGCTLNTKTGEYKSTYNKRIEPWSISWTLRKTIGEYHLFDWRGSANYTHAYPDPHNCSNVLQYVDYDQTNYYNRAVPENVDKTFSVNAGGRIYVWSTASNVTEFKEWLRTIGAYFVYRRNTAINCSTTPTEIEVYEGDNTFSLEDGTVQLNYKSFANYTDIADFKKYNFRLNFDTVKTIAHRGDDTVAPQCTKPAYIAAKKNGAKYAENDLNMSSDGAYVMWHDTTLSRLGTYLKAIDGYDMYTDGTLYYWYDSPNDKLYTWDGYNYLESSVQISTLTQCAGADYSVTTLPLVILKHIDFGAYKGTAFKGTQILTFAEWVLLCKQLGLSCYVDQKATFSDSVASTIVGVARNLGMLDKMTWLASGHSGTIRTYDPKARVLILSNPTTALIEQYSPLLSGGPVVFGGDAASLTEEAVHLALTAGFEVEGYYVDVNTSEESQLAFIKTLVGYGVTGLTLDHYFVSDAFADMILN